MVAAPRPRLPDLAIGLCLLHSLATCGGLSTRRDVDGLPVRPGTYRITLFGETYIRRVRRAEHGCWWGLEMLWDGATWMSIDAGCLYFATWERIGP